MITISKEANPNYLCKIVQLKGLEKHSNADRLQVVSIDFQQVITGLDAKDEDVYVYFPVESKINPDFLRDTNSYRKASMNIDNDPQKTGFFEEKGRVKAVKLRGEKSMGYIVPIQIIYKWAGVNILDSGGVFIDIDDVGKEFDTINGIKIVEKYKIEKKSQNGKEGKKPKLSRLVEGQVHLHTNTENLRRNSHKINPDDMISITYKTHGTSWWVANVLTKRKLSLLERVSKFLGVNVQDKVYDLVYGSRRVVKNADLEDPKAKDHYYGYDLWEEIKNEIGSKIPKGYTVYGEMLGYGKNGEEIQKGYDYGCAPFPTVGNVPTHKLEVYRITRTNPDGLVTEMTHPEIIEFCKGTGLEASHMFYYGKAKDWRKTRNPYIYDEIGHWKSVSEPIIYHHTENEAWREQFVKDLESEYNEKDCFMCNKKVPEEGIVVRKDSVFYFEAYKLKSFRFLEKESKQLDTGEVDVESDN